MFEGILILLNKLPGGSGQPYKPPQSQTPVVPQPAHPTYIPPVPSVPKEVEPDHPMTYAIYDPKCIIEELTGVMEKWE